jgi:hypothetical protein
LGLRDGHRLQHSRFVVSPIKKRVGSNGDEQVIFVALVKGFLGKAPILNMASQQIRAVCRSRAAFENENIGVLNMTLIDLVLTGADQQFVARRGEQFEIADAQIEALDRFGVQKRKNEQGLGRGGVHGEQS